MGVVDKDHSAGRRLERARRPRSPGSTVVRKVAMVNGSGGQGPLGGTPTGTGETPALPRIHGGAKGCDGEWEWWTRTTRRDADWGGRDARAPPDPRWCERLRW